MSADLIFTKAKKLRRTRKAFKVFFSPKSAPTWEDFQEMQRRAEIWCSITEASFRRMNRTKKRQTYMVLAQYFGVK